MRKTYLIIFILVAGVLSSFSLLDYRTGSELDYPDARAAAMGNTGVVGGNRLFDSFLNPANLSWLKSDFGFQYGFDLIQVNDKRSLPMYNSFDAYSGNATYVDNLNYFDYHNLMIYYRFKMKDFSLSTSAFSRPFISFDSDYFEEVRNNANSDYDSYPPILAKNFIKGKGTISAKGGQLAFKFKNLFSAGFSVASLDGKSDWDRDIIWQDDAYQMMLATQDTLSDSHNYLKREFNALQIMIGSNLRLNDRLSLGISFQPEIDFQVTGTIDDLNVEDVVYMYYSNLDSTQAIVHTDSIMFSELILPAKYRLGISYRPRNIMSTYFNLEAEMVRWSNVNRFFEDQYDFYIGIEHNIRYAIPIRFGFNFQTKYTIQEQDGFSFAQKVSMPGFTVGTGFEILQKFIVDFALSYTNRQYETLDLFMDSYYDYAALWANYQYLNLQDRGWENPDTVKETILGLKASVSFDW
jgi:hypothetical protein